MHASLLLGIPPRHVHVRAHVHPPDHETRGLRSFLIWQGIAIEDLVPELTELIVDRFGGSLKPEFEAAQADWRKAR